MANSVIKKTTLKNGLRIVTIPQRGTRTVTVLLLVGTGSKYETEEQNGISHFLEHMFFKGTTRRPSPLRVAEVLDRVGGMYNAFTGEDYTGYYAKVDEAHWKLALDWVADIFLHSTLPIAEIEKEKGVVKEEMHLYRDNPARHTDDLWMKLLYGDQPAGRNVVGSEKSISWFSQQSLKAYRETQYVASNTVVCLAGNVKSGAVELEIRKLFERLSSAQPKSKDPVREEQQKPEVALEYRRIKQTHLALGVRGYNLSDPKRYAQYLLAVLLGGMMSSRLFGEVREKLGLAYSITTSSECDPDSGYVVTAAGVANGNVETVIQIILKEYRRLKKERVPAAELRKAKDYEKGKMALQLESSDAKAQFYAMQELLQDKVLTPEQIYDKIESIKAPDITRAAQEIFQPAKLNLVVLGPHKNKESFVKLLRV